MRPLARIAGVEATLYSLKVSHPSRAAKAMLERKGIPFSAVELVPGMHPQLVRLRGFDGPTVPALRLDGRRIQGTTLISRELDLAVEEPALFPRDPDERKAVEDAERWGDEELQETPRKIFRWYMTTDRNARRWLWEQAGLPLPGLNSYVGRPIAARFARISDATDETVRAEIAEIPGRLDRVDALIEAGTIGGTEPNAADYQIGCTVRMLLEYPQFREPIDSRPAGKLARRLYPEFPGPLPAEFPDDWVAPLKA
jgi:glutathione S-transferase